jgi:hypothetical protein
MFIVYECAVCVLVVALGMTLLFTACVMFLVLVEGGSILAHTLRNLGDSTLLPHVRRMAAESRDSQ